MTSISMRERAMRIIEIAEGPKPLGGTELRRHDAATLFKNKCTEVIPDLRFWSSISSSISWTYLRLESMIRIFEETYPFP